MVMSNMKIHENESSGGTRKYIELYAAIWSDDPHYRDLIDIMQEFKYDFTDKC